MASKRSDINQIFLTGELAADPEHRELNTGLPVANVKLLVTSRFLSTNEVQAISPINLTFYGPAVDWTVTLQRGSRVAVQGELVVRATSPTANRHTTEVVVRQLEELAAGRPLVNDDPSTWG
jgi:single-stranded DNA-binding protein